MVNPIDNLLHNGAIYLPGYLEPALKMWIMFESKARCVLKAESALGG